MDTHTVNVVLNSYTSRNRGSPIAALRKVALIAEARHQLRPCARDALHVPSMLRGLVRIAVAGKGRAHDVKRVGSAAAVRGRIGERLDEFFGIHDRAGASRASPQ